MEPSSEDEDSSHETNHDLHLLAAQPAGHRGQLVATPENARRVSAESGREPRAAHFSGWSPLRQSSALEAHMGIIYTIVAPNGKIYVGQCKRKKRRKTSKRLLTPQQQLQLRWEGHCGKGSGCILRHAIAKYGADNFTRQILLVAPDKDLDYWERHFIKAFSSDAHAYGYNRTEGGEGGGFTIPKVREQMLQPGSVWRMSQQRASVISAKRDAIAKPEVQAKRRKHATEATQTQEYRAAQSEVQKRSWATSSKRESRAATAERKREALLEALPPEERAVKETKLQKQREAQARYKERKAMGLTKTYRTPA